MGKNNGNKKGGKKRRNFGTLKKTRGAKKFQAHAAKSTSQAGQSVSATTSATSLGPDSKLPGPSEVQQEGQSSPVEVINSPPSADTSPDSESSRKSITEKITVHMSHGSDCADRTTQEEMLRKMRRPISPSPSTSNGENENVKFISPSESDSDEPAKKRFCKPQLPKRQKLNTDSENNSFSSPTEGESSDATVELEECQSSGENVVHSTSPEQESETLIHGEMKSPASTETIKSTSEEGFSSSPREELCLSSEEEVRIKPPKAARKSTSGKKYIPSPRKVILEPENREPLPERTYFTHHASKVKKSPRESPKTTPVEPPKEEERCVPVKFDLFTKPPSPVQYRMIPAKKSTSGRNVYLPITKPAKPEVTNRPVPPSNGVQSNLEKKNGGSSRTFKIKSRTYDLPGQPSKKNDENTNSRGDCSVNVGASTSRAGCKEPRESQPPPIRPDLDKSGGSSSED